MKPVLAVALITTVVSAVPADLIACGDKFLVPSRATRVNSPPPRRSAAAILLYSTPSSEMSRSLVRLSVIKKLQKAGYQVTVIDSPAQLTNALRQNRWDLVLLDFDDVDVVTARGSADVPAMVPVSYSVSGPQWTDARRQYPLLIKGPTRAQHWLDTVDAALETQRKNRTTASRR